MAAPNGGLSNGSSSSIPSIVNTPAPRVHPNNNNINGGSSGYPASNVSRESSLGPAGSDTSESSVDSSNQLKPRKLFRIRSRAGEITFGKLMTQPQYRARKCLQGSTAEVKIIIFFKVDVIVNVSSNEPIAAVSSGRVE
ncbi:hypothetical protein PoB_007086500 [Plakobranchus ocellatus]|uniref:Uncharacterized protein n=1 Tax=Plakobranchus ocellatus TaxID=259542 RepID=A0AAV4DK49_9GAST|nr:hypothetical protein PoB_007086500 [Plakobranchus ocellatus]